MPFTLNNVSRSKDDNGEVDVSQLVKACKAATGDNVDFNTVMSAFRKHCDASKGSFSQHDLEKICEALTSKCPPSTSSPRRNPPAAIPNTPINRTPTSSPADHRSSHQLTPPSQQIFKFGGATDSSQHSVDEEEVEQFVIHINSQLANDDHLVSHVPIDASSGDLFKKCNDGLVLAKLINDSVPETIDERALNKHVPLNTFQATENNNLVINSAKAIGCSVVNIGSQDLIDGRPHLVLGLVWQIIKKGLFAKISLHYHPELYRLLDKNEKLDDFLKLPAEAILIRWFNYHLKAANWHRIITNFTNDVNDSENYIVLMNQLCPGVCTLGGLKEPSLQRRAEGVLESAEKIDCRQYLTAKAIVQGNPKLNIAFVANLFNKHPGLERLSDAELAALDDGLFASKGDRESRSFALWMNSLPVEPFVHCLYDDLRDGRVLLQVIDRIRPGAVNWRTVGKVGGSASRFQFLENTNQVVDICRRVFKFSAVGIQGADITDGNGKLTLGLVWQLMRQHIIETLALAGISISDDNVIVSWANEVVGTSYRHISSFKDPSLCSSLFFLHLLDKLSPNTVDFSIVCTDPNVDEGLLKLNAKYAISVARKLGATIFVLPEDILEVKPKMIMTFIGTLMGLKSV